MTVIEHIWTGKTMLAASTDPATARTWWVGNGRVTAAEIESWQLGPDLTGSHALEETSS